MKPLSHIFSLITIFLAAILVQTIAVMYFTRTADTTSKSDAAIVLAGAPQREEKAVLLARQGRVEKLLFTNTKQESTDEFRKKYNPPSETALIGCGQSHSSFEDIYTAARILKDQDITSVALVTSDYHLPRTLFLLKSYLLFNSMNIAVSYTPVDEDLSGSVRLHRAYSESIKFVGSTFEMLICCVSGDWLLQWPPTETARGIIKKILFL